MAPTILLLVFDTPAVLAGTTREWQRFGKLGTCHLPKVVFEELRFLCNRAPEPAQETIAREFFRFFPTSGWQTYDNPKSHPALKPADGQGLSKRARQTIAILESVYGLTRAEPHSGVVLISNTPPLIQKLKVLEASNLCGIPYPGLKQWSLSGQRPDRITQMLSRAQTQTAARSTPRSPATIQPIESPHQATAPKPSLSSIPKTKSPKTKGMTGRSRSRQPIAAQLISLVLVVFTLSVAGLVAWRMLQPQKFDAFWQQHSPF
ncbi:MAG: PIN domain-containing protein [Cyanobacteria bacterium P01_A01_bin.123]